MSESEHPSYRIALDMVGYADGAILFLVNADPTDRTKPDLECPDPIVLFVYSEEQAIAALAWMNMHRHGIRRVREFLRTNDIPAAVDPAVEGMAYVWGVLAVKLFDLHHKHRRIEPTFLPCPVFPDAISFVYGRIAAKEAVLYGFIDGDLSVGVAVFYASEAFEPVMKDLFFHEEREEGGLHYGMTSLDAARPDSLYYEEKGLVHFGVIRGSNVSHLPRSFEGASHVLLRGFPAFYVCELMRLEAGVAPEFPPAMRPPIAWPGEDVPLGERTRRTVELRYAAIARENLLITGKPGPAPR